MRATFKPNSTLISMSTTRLIQCYLYYRNAAVNLQISVVKCTQSSNFKLTINIESFLPRYIANKSKLQQQNFFSSKLGRHKVMVKMFLYVPVQVVVKKTSKHHLNFGIERRDLKHVLRPPSWIPRKEHSCVQVDTLTIYTADAVFKACDHTL